MAYNKAPLYAIGNFNATAVLMLQQQIYDLFIAATLFATVLFRLRLPYVTVSVIWAFISTVLLRAMMDFEASSNSDSVYAVLTIVRNY
jgi:hypothetical protein